MALFKPYDNIDNVPITDGWIYFLTKDHKLRADVDGQRYVISGESTRIYLLTIAANAWTSQEE